jgi:hypothetical protein
MSGDMALTAGSAAASISLVVLFLAQWRFRARTRRDLAGLRAALQLHVGDFEEKHAGLKKELSAIQAAAQDVPEPPRPGALNKSLRTQALHLLRSGASPETAAASLGLGKREMRLLERVALTLYTR